jgi:hypothetical protein
MIFIIRRKGILKPKGTLIPSSFYDYGTIWRPRVLQEVSELEFTWMRTSGICTIKRVRSITFLMIFFTVKTILKIGSIQ